MVPFLQDCLRFTTRFTLLMLALACGLPAQTCDIGSEIDPPTTTAIEAAAKQFFNMSAQGDVAGLKAGAMPEIAGSFAGIEQAVVTNKLFFAQGQPSDTRIFVLDASDSKTALPHADFYCGIYNSPDRVGFSIPNLPPGRYAISIARLTGVPHPITLTLILQDAAKNTWKLAGYYARRNAIGGHDGQWFLSKAREYKEKWQVHNAWLYYLTAWDLTAPVDFMGTPQLDKLSDEIQAARPSDLASVSTPLILSGSAKTFKVTDIVGVALEDRLAVRVQFETPDAANPALASQDNLAVSKALLVKYPEFRDAFTDVIARATDQDGHTYVTVTPMKDIK